MSLACMISAAPVHAETLNSYRSEPVALMLELSVNGSGSSRLMHVQRFDDGELRLKADDLRHLRIRVAANVANDEMVSLRNWPSIQADYNEAKQTLALQVPDHLLEPYTVDLYSTRSQRIDENSLDALPATVFNYGLYHSRQSGQNTFGANAELLLTGRYGLLSNTALFNSRAQAGFDNTVRLDTRWQYIDPVNVRSYVVGDFVSNATSWGASVRLTGVQWASAFDQRSDLVTTALPQFSGSAALPSTLDLYVNQQRIYSGDIPSGPFELRALPFVSGNEVSLVTTDIHGRQRTLTQPYYYSARLLQPALTQFSVDVGIPRLFYGLRSNIYDNTVFGSGVFRHGLRHTTTLEAHTQSTGDGLINVGVGLAQGLGGRGVLSGAMAVSRYRHYRGAHVNLGVEGRISRFRLYAAADRNMGDYFNLGRVSAYRLAQKQQSQWLGSGGRVALNTVHAKAVDRLGLGVRAFQRSSLNLSYHRIRYSNTESRTGSVSVSYGLSPRMSVQANAYTDFNQRRNRGVFLSLNIALDTLNAATSISRDNQRLRHTQQLGSTTGQRQGESSWGVVNTIEAQGSDYRSAYLSYRARPALVSARVHQSDQRTRTELQATGSVVVAGGGVFAANQVGDAYAIVTNAGPNVELLQSGVKQGRTNRKGQALLPNLRPYSQQRVRIDPTTLPHNWEPRVTEQVVSTGYRQGMLIDFGARPVHAAVVLIHDKHDIAIPPGHIVQLEGGGVSVMGYGGEVYVRDLQKHNRLHIDLGPQGVCSTQFHYDSTAAVQPRIGPLLCQ